MSSPDTPRLTTSPSHEPSLWMWAAILVSLAALAGSLYLTLGMNLKPCPLCYYQRTFVMAVAAVLIVGLFVKEVRSSVVSLLAVPLAVAGLGVAGYHEFLVQNGTLECPHGVLQIGTAPQQSLAILAVLTLLLIIDQIRVKAVAAAAATIVLGGLLAFSSVKSTKSAVPDYNLSLDEDMCRPVKKS